MNECVLTPPRQTTVHLFDLFSDRVGAGKEQLRHSERRYDAPRQSVIADQPHILAAEYVVGVAQFVGGGDHRDDGNGDLLVGPGEVAHRVRHGDALRRKRQRMRCAEIVTFARMLVHVAMPGIAKAAAMPEDVERSGVAVLAVARRVVIRLRVVEEDASLIGRLAVEDAMDLQIGAGQPMLRRGEVDRYRTRGECLRTTSNPARRAKASRPRRALLAWRGSSGVRAISLSLRSSRRSARPHSRSQDRARSARRGPAH